MRAWSSSGHPSNYVARGFVSGLRVNVCVGDGYFPTALLVKPLTDNAFDGRRWRFSESPACEIDEREAEEYDKRFPSEGEKDAALSGGIFHLFPFEYAPLNNHRQAAGKPAACFARLKTGKVED